MTRSVFPFYAGDISELARSLRSQLAACDHTPGHVELSVGAVVKDSAAQNIFRKGDEYIAARESSLRGSGIASTGNERTRNVEENAGWSRVPASGAEATAHRGGPDPVCSRE